jgi:hypothetical protein
MSGGWFEPRRLQFNETITSRCAFVAPQNPTAPPQGESEGPYRGRSSISPRLAWWAFALMDGGVKRPCTTC